MKLRLLMGTILYMPSTCESFSIPKAVAVYYEKIPAKAPAHMQYIATIQKISVDKRRYMRGRYNGGYICASNELYEMTSRLCSVLNDRRTRIKSEELDAQ